MLAFNGCSAVSSPSPAQRIDTPPQQERPAFALPPRYHNNDRVRAYFDWTHIRINNVIERLNRKIRRRTRVAGTLPNGNSALMLVCARLRHVAGTQWGNKKYMNMRHLEAALEDASLAG